MNIVSIERPIGIGATKPYLVKCSDGKKYVAKFPGNPEGTKVLISEYVCGELAKRLKLPLPRYELVNLDNIEIFKNQLNDIEHINGTVFCSEWLDKSTALPGYYIITKTENKFDSIKILIFDVIIGNNDRNRGNLLINLKNNTLVMIDHSHVFVYEALWNAYNLKDLIKTNIEIDRMNQYNFQNLSLCLNDRNYIQYVKEFVYKIKNITENDIIEIIKSIPNDWDASNEDKETLKLFLLDRIRRIDEICCILNIEGGD